MKLGEPKPDRAVGGHSRGHLGHVLADEVPEVEVDLLEHMGVLPGALDAGTPGVAAALHAAELTGQDAVERVDLLLSPLDARAHHRLREAPLKAAHRVPDDAEVHERELPDVRLQIALENTLPVF